MNNRSFLLALATAGVCAALPAVASAATESTSENWGGYMVTAKDSESFSTVSGEWTQPTVTCTDSGDAEYSAYWLGLGGGDENSEALEQIGTEADCSADGTVSYYAWYELVPSAPAKIKMTVRAGDALYARTTVNGDQVSFILVDQTTGARFTRTLTMTSVTPDTETAEWVTEAPSECSNSSLTDCTTLPLADFGTARFRDAHANSDGYKGSIATARYKRTEIQLESSTGSTFGGGQGGYFGGGQGFPGGDGPGTETSTSTSNSTATEATPSALSGDGTAFSVIYSSTSSTTTSTTTTTTSGAGGTTAGI